MRMNQLPRQHSPMLDTDETRRYCERVAQRLGGDRVDRFVLLGNAGPELGAIARRLDARLQMDRERFGGGEELVRAEAELARLREEAAMLHSRGWGFSDGWLRAAFNRALGRAFTVLDGLERMERPHERAERSPTADPAGQRDLG
jgi:hypothetical protein